MKIRVVVTGRSYHLADGIPDELILSDEASVEDAIRELNARLPDDTRFPPSCLVAVSGQHVGTVASFENRRLRDGDELTLIAPVAGGC